MKRKGILIAGALIAVTGAGAFAAWLFHPEPGPAAPHIAPALPPSMGASAPVQSQAMLLRGQYLARAADCAACHTARGGTPYAGGLRMNTPFGAIHSTNITPHVVHGIGAYTYEEFDRAVRHGIRRDGKYLYPAMPYPEYAGISDEDMQALYAYFMNGVQPSAEANLDNALPWPFSVRAGLRAWNAWFKPPAPPAPDPGRDPDWRRGAYLVRTLGHCGSCHTPRGMLGQPKAMSEEDGADYLGGAVLDDWYAPGLARSLKTGARTWTEDDIVTYLETGRTEHKAAFGPMSEVVQHSTQYLTDADRRAIAVYLLSLPVPGDDDDTDTERLAQQPTQASSELANATPRSLGARLYLDNCIGCHRADGQGDPRTFPALAGNSAIISDDATSLIHIILAGSAMPATERAPTPLSMPGFAWRLSDAEVAELASYVRSNWGNGAKPVSADEVAQVRRSTGLPGAR